MPQVTLPIPLRDIYTNPERTAKKGRLFPHLTTGRKLLFFIGGFFLISYVLMFIFMVILRNDDARMATLQPTVEAELQAKIAQCFSDHPPSSPNDVPGPNGKNLDFKGQMKALHLTREQVLRAHGTEIDTWRQEIEAHHTSGSGQVVVYLIFGIGAAFWIGILVIVIQHRRGKRWKRGGQGAHGSAQWARRDEVITAPQHRWVIPLWCANDGTARPWTMKETRGLFTAAGLCAWAPPEGDAVCSHFLLIGATGSGKGAGIFSHVMCSSNVPSIYQDVKAECPNIDHPQWKNAIRWGCAADGGWPSMRWNPLQEAFDDVEPEDACLTVASLLLPDNEGEDAWVSQLARPILAELFLSRKWATIGGFADEVRGMKLESILELANIPGGLQSMMEGKNVPQYLSAAFHSNLAAYRMGWGRTVTSAHDFTLDDMIDKGGYVLSAETQDLRRAPLRLFWALLLRRLMRSARPRPLNLLMDEAKAAGKIPDVVNALVTLRNRRVSIWMSFQSEAAITSVYKKDEAEALVDGFGNRITLLHGISARDAKQLSENMRSWSKKRGGHVGINMGQMPSLSVTSGTDDITALPLISAEDIETRGRRPGERWAIIAARETTKSGHPLIVQMVEGEQLTRLPNPDEAQPTQRGRSLQEILDGEAGAALS